MNAQAKKIREDNLIKKIKDIEKYKEYFVFSPNISTIEDLEENLDKEVSITHKECNHIETEMLSEWLRKVPYKLKSAKSKDLKFLCANCSTKELQKKIDYMYNGEFKIVGSFVNTKTKLEIYHTKCDETFTVRYESIMSGKMKCKVCKHSDINLKKEKEETKEIWFLNKLKEENLNDFIPQEPYRGYTTEILFKHEKCNKTFSETPRNFFRRKNKCPHCNAEAFIINSSKEKVTSKNLTTDKIQLIQNKMDLYYNGEFKYLGINPNDKYTVELEHTKCKRTFIDYRKKLYTNKIECPYCSENKAIRNNFISIKDKIKIYEDKLEGKFLIIDGFTNQKEKIRVKRVKCGHIIHRSLDELLKTNYSDSCPECKRLDRLESLNTKLELKYNGRIIVLNGKEKYKNNRSSLLFLDNRCNEKFISSFTDVLNSNNFKCPNCETNNNLTSSIKSEVYTKFKGEYLMLSDYIDSKTPIKFRHTTCNHIFSKTKHQFFNAKIPCTECSKKSRSLGIKKAQEKVNKKFGNLFTIRGIYVNNTTDIPIICNNCNTVEEISLNKLLNRKQCIHCKSKYL